MLQRDPLLLTNYISYFMLYVVLNVKGNNYFKPVPLKAVYSLKELAESQVLMSVPQKWTI